MSDGDKPIFFGGLPPRSGAPAGESVGDTSEDLPSRWRKILIVGIPVAVVLALGLAFGPGIVQNVIGDPHAPGADFVEQPVSAEDQAKAEAAIAEGGGAVAGHIVSGELCTAIDAYVAVSNGVSSGPDAPADVIAAMEVLAGVDSPYQDEYANYASWVKAPESIDSMEDAQVIATEFAKAVQVDVATCA